MFWRKKKVAQPPLHEVPRPLDLLVQRWREPSCCPLAAATPDAVRAVFAKAGMVATPDVIELYGRIGGMAHHDDHMWQLWPLDEVADNLFKANEYGLLFSDYFMNSWCYRLKPTGAASSAVFCDYFNGKPPQKVADSLENFFGAYFDDPLALLENPPSSTDVR